MTECIEKQNPAYTVCKLLILNAKTSKTESKKWKNIIYANGVQKQGIALLMADKTGFKQKLIRRDKSLHTVKGNNPTKRYNGRKYLCPKCWCT